MENLAKAGKRGDAGRLEIGFYTSLSSGALRDTSLAVASEHPAVEINIIEGARASSLANHLSAVSHKVRLSGSS